MRPFDFAVVAGTTPTSTGTADYLTTGIGGAPLGAEIECWRTDGANDFETGLSFCVGYVDGTDERCVSGWSESGAAAAVSHGQGSDQACIRLFDPSTGSLVVEAVFDSFVTNGLRLNFTTVDSTAWRVVVRLFFGTDLDISIYECPGLDQGQRYAHICGYAPSFIKGVAVPNLSETDFDGCNWYPHICVAGSPSTDSAMSNASGHGEDPTVSATQNYTDRVAHTFDLTTSPILHAQRVHTLIFSTDRVTFEALAGVDVGPAPMLVGLAVRPSDRQVYHGRNVQTPASASDVGFAVGWRPAWVDLLLSGNTTTGSQGLGFLSHGGSDFRQEHHVSLHDRHNVGTTDTRTRYDARAVQLYNTAGVLALEGNIDTRTATGWIVSFDTVVGTQRRYHILGVQESPFEAAGDAASPAAGASAVGRVVVTAAGAAASPAATASAVGRVVVTAAGAAASPAATASAVGRVVVTAAGAAASPAATASAVGLHTAVTVEAPFEHFLEASMAMSLLQETGISGQALDHATMVASSHPRALLAPEDLPTAYMET